jgi:hypothetical protein
LLQLFFSTKPKPKKPNLFFLSFSFVFSTHYAVSKTFPSPSPTPPPKCISHTHTTTTTTTETTTMRVVGHLTKEQIGKETQKNQKTIRFAPSKLHTQKPNSPKTKPRLFSSIKAPHSQKNSKSLQKLQHS